MASTEVVEQQSQPLQSNKRWVLRVSIHCEGCKRKVKKLLQSLPGVDDIEIETKLQRVVVTGDISPETLIRKLVKSGKPAQLWPENPPQIPNQKPPTTHPQEPNPPPAKPETPAADPSKNPVSGGGKVDEAAAGKTEVTAGDGKLEQQKPETESAGNRDSDQKKEEQTGQTSGGAGAEGRRKKKKKSQNIYKDVNGNEPATTLPSNQSPPRHQGYHPPPPVYTVSYNTAHPPPANRYMETYYATPPPQAYAYSHHRSEMDPQPPSHHQPSDFDPYSRPPPLDSFEMFSDENPNGCLVM